MNYLNKIVGLSGATDPAPGAGVKLVNDLPVITDDFAKGVSKDNSINEVWQRVLLNAKDTLEFDLYSAISKDDRFRQLMSITKDFGFSSNAGLLSSQVYEGARFYTQRQKATNLIIKSVYVSGTGSFTVKIFDLVTGNELYSSPAPAVITNEGYIPVNKKLSLDKLKNLYFVGVEAVSNLDAINGNLGFIGDRCVNFPIEVTSGSMSTLAQKKDANFTPGQCYVHVEAEVSSDMESFISDNADLFALAAQYLCGYLLLNESLTTTRHNLFTSTNRQVRLEESMRQEEIYKNNLKKTVQQALMRLTPTVIVEPKSAIEKEGIYTMSLIDEDEFRNPYY